MAMETAPMATKDAQEGRQNNKIGYQKFSLTQLRNRDLVKRGSNEQVLTAY